MDYDRNIHHNPDAQAWAKFFIETTKDMDREVFRDEGYMIAWFANSMMAMHDSMAEKEDLERKYRIAIGYISTMPEFSDKHPLEVAAHFDAIGAANYKELREATTEMKKWTISVAYEATNDDGKKFRAKTVFQTEAENISAAYKAADQAFKNKSDVKLGAILPGHHITML